MVSVFSSLPVEDDTALSVAEAGEAALLFQTGNFVECLRSLDQLLLKKDDPKVRHNMVVAENFQDGCSDPKKLIEALENIKKQIKELAPASGEQSEVTRNEGQKPVAGMKGTHYASNQFSHSSVVYSSECNTSVAMFNIAVVWFHLHKYAKSFLYLDSLYQSITPIDEGTALRVCLLLLDVALLSHHASRSADVISYMEKVFCVNNLTSQVDNGMAVQQQSLLVSRSSSLQSNSTLPDSSHSDSFVTANSSLENSLTRTLSDEALEDDSLQLLSSLDITGQNLQRSLGIASSGNLSRSQSEESLSVVDVRLKLHLYKVRFFLLTRNLKAAKREVKMAMNLACGEDYLVALYLKSQLEYARRNYPKAIKLLMASGNHSETVISSMYYNNLGCIYFQLGKHQTSGVFLSKALKNSSHVRKDKPPKLSTLSQDKSFLIAYNCGMHYLACGKPFHAAQCFQNANLIFYNRPLLWLRIAECCLMASVKGLIKSYSQTSDICDIRVDVVGRGKWRQLALRYGTLPNGLREHVEKENLFPSDSKLPDLTLSLAWQCLLNALYLLESSEIKYSRFGFPPITTENGSREAISSECTDHKPIDGNSKEFTGESGSSQPNSNGEVKEPKGSNNQSTSLQSSVADYEHFHVKENQMMRQVILADLAYVELALGNPMKALSTAKSLLKLHGCSRIYIYLGTMYVAEALCLLNRPKEAAEHLSMYVSGENNAELPYTLEDCDKWKEDNKVDVEDSTRSHESQVSLFTNPEEARGIFCANYAANIALLGNLEQAHHFMTNALSDIPNNAKAILTAIYLDLKCGKTQEALAKLKQHNAAKFLESNLT